MSNAAYALRNGRTIRSDVQALRRRANLSLVRPGQRRAGAMPFLLTIGAMLLGGLVGLLMFNTSMQNVAFQQNALQAEATDLAAQQQTLDMQLASLNDPQHIASTAKKLGMVIPQTVAFIKIPNGQILGTPTPADGSATPNLWVPNPKPYYPAPVTRVATKPVLKTTTKSTTSTTSTTGTSTAKKPVARH